MTSVTITLDQNELNALSALLDAGVKSLGIGAVKPAAMLLVKLEAAVAEANKPPQKDDE
jgi:hypothetical protein